MKCVQNVFKVQVGKVRIELMPDPRYVDAEGRRMVSVKITHNRVRYYIPTGEKLDGDGIVRLWTANKGDFYRRRNECVAVMRRVEDEVRRMVAEGKYDFRDIKRMMDGRCRSTFQSTMERRNVGLKGNSAATYRTALRVWSDFGGPETMRDVSFDHLRRFAVWMNAKGYSTSSQRIWLACLRTLFIEEVANGNITSNPFDDRRFKMPPAKKRVDCHMDIATWRKLYDAPHDRYVDMFIFSYLANGMNLADIAELRYDQHYFASGGTEFRYERAKTAHENHIVIFIPITDHVRAIVDRIGAKPTKNGRVFPQVLETGSPSVGKDRKVGSYGRLINIHIQKAAFNCGIEAQLSMTWARHSYKTNLMRLGAPEAFTEQMLGHVDSSVGGFYRGSFSHEDRVKWNSMLLG